MLLYLRCKNLKTQKNSFDHQILAKLIRRQLLLSSESKIKETRDYVTSASKTFTETEKVVENDQLYLEKKGFSLGERKLILFAISHLESLSAKSSFKSVFPNRKKLLDFLSQAYKSFPSNYEVHAQLLYSLSSKIKVSYNELVEEIIMSIESKTSKTSIDYLILFN